MVMLKCYSAFQKGDWGLAEGEGEETEKNKEAKGFAKSHQWSSVA